MLMCNKNCIYSDKGYCLLSAEENISGVINGCDSFKERRNFFVKLENKVNSFPDGANVNKLNGRWDI